MKSAETDFWDNLRSANEEMRDNQRLLILPSTDKLKLYWGGVKEQGSCMLVRDCYEKLFMLFEHDWSQQSSHYLLLGTPGIGKSFFLYYVANRLLKGQATSSKPFKVIIQTGSQGSARYLLQKKGKSKLLSDSDMHALLGDPDNYYLIDSSLPLVVPNAQTLLVSYPDPRLYEYYERHSVVKKVYMPTWSLAECLAAKKQIFPLCDDSSFLCNFEKLGGIPRFVLYKPNRLPVEDQLIKDEYIRESLTLLTTSKRSFLSSLMCDTIYEPNEIVQYEVPSEDVTFKNHYVKLASLYVTQIVLRNLADKQKHELARMITEVALTHRFAMEKLEFFVQALMLGIVEDWPRRFDLKLLRGPKSLADIKSTEFFKLDHVNCGFSRLMGVEDVERLEHERRKKGYDAMWGVSVIPQPSGIDGVYIDDKHVELLYMKPQKDRKISTGAVREVMTLFKGQENRSIWIQNVCLEDQFETATPIDYDGFPEEVHYLDDNVAQFALGLSLSEKTSRSLSLTERAPIIPKMQTVSPRGGIVE